MLNPETKNLINELFFKLKLQNENNESSKDKAAKMRQLLAYLDIIISQVGKYSRKRKLVFIDSCAGNCLLSFLVYFYFTEVDKRNIEIHCVDTNQKLMDKNRARAKEFGFNGMIFQTSDVGEYQHKGQPDLIYSLHACDTATDKTLYLGLKTRAKNILSVSCCQHSLKMKKKSNHNCSGLTRNNLFKEKMIYMVADSLRSILMQMQGYKVDLLEFVSSRATNKNTMLRARIDQIKKINELEREYFNLQNTFYVLPALEQLLREKPLGVN